MPDFAHLHCHTQFSLLDGASDIATMMQKAVNDGQKAVAITDHGNMFGAFQFVNEAKKKGIKAIVGCEFYMVEDRWKNSFLKSKGERDKRYHQLMLAKNQKGYQNLSKLCSLGFMEGMYSKFPRIDKELILQYHEGLIATSCCIGAEIPQAILRGDLEKADKLTRWWKDLFEDDFYIEIQRHHGLENIDQTGVSQEDINQELIKLARKYDIKIIATNDSHYVEEEDSKPHDILLCVNTASNYADDKRFKFPSADFYFKTQAEMGQLFSDIPEALDYTQEIIGKVETPVLERDILLPNYPLPAEFTNQPDFLRDLVYKGAKRKYSEVNASVSDRLDLELGIIKDMGFDGYFLIVQDFIAAARDMGVSVGPGRGSAAGSAVAYCLDITNIEPIKYNLLFERFLNPERVSMPDIDIDFDDEGRQRVIDWVVEKYGKKQVAQIITYGRMKAKSSIRDVGRVMRLPLDVTGQMAKLVPSKPGTNLNQIIRAKPNELKKDWMSEDISNIQKLQEILSRNSLEGEVLDLSTKVEGAVRNTGIHAAGLIIAPDDITNYIPVCKLKDADLLVTQFDGSQVEDSGMLKMDFLGLKTLSVIKDAVKNIKKRQAADFELNVDELPLDDEKTFELFQKGEMVGIFQFESEGMQMYLKELKPTNIEDLIAMNALYRPGPMENIPSFIRRKHGTEVVEYPHEWLKEILEPTYGIMVYQEQIMQAAQIMADYSLGKADLLRRAMGKKKVSVMNEQREIFNAGATAKGVDEKVANEIFDLMAKFAAYGFNRSHAAAYSVVAYHTGYLKANYPAEYMASVLTHNKNDITKLNFFLRECKRMRITVLGPDINESDLNFTVNEEGNIRFGMSALKGVGEGPVTEILEQRKEGNFKSIFNLTTRVNLRTVNKKCIESLALGGAFDSFNQTRASYFTPVLDRKSIIEESISYGNSFQNQKAKSVNSLFGDITESFLKEPSFPDVIEWPLIDKLTKEKEVAGIFISGHPLDDYAVELKNFTSCPLDRMDEKKGSLLDLGGLVVEAADYTSQKGVGYGKYVVQDFTGSLGFNLYRNDYANFGTYLKKGQVVYIKGKHVSSKDGLRNYFKILDVQLLDTIGEAKTKSITIEVPLKKLDDTLLANIEQLLASTKGKHKIKFAITDESIDRPLKMMSTSIKVTADSLFIKEIEKIGLRYRVN